MRTHKLSVSIPEPLYEFLENYQSEQNYKSRSAVVNEALKLLRQAQLEACYQKANEELNDDFEQTAADGLEENETW